MIINDRVQPHPFSNHDLLAPGDLKENKVLFWFSEF